MSYDPYNYDRSGNKGPKLILIILLLCVGSFVVWFVTQTDNPDRNKIADFLYDTFGFGSSDTRSGTSKNIELKGTCYYYQQLSEYEKEAYESLYQACEYGISEAKINPIVPEEFNRALYAFRYDHPEFFWLQGEVRTTLMYGSVYRANCLVPPDAFDKMAEMDKKAEEILKDAPKSDYDKVKYIYEYIINNTDYDLDAPDNQTAYSALINGRSVCAGYANAFLFLCDKAGIYCGYVSGDVVGRGPHGWNFIKINGNYYWVDVTWGDPVFLDDSKKTDNLNYDYFCVSDKDIMTDRRINSTPAFLYPQCVDDSLNYYINTDIYFESYDKDKIYEYLMDKVGLEGQREIELKFANEIEFRKAVADLVESSDFWTAFNRDIKKKYGISLHKRAGTLYEKSHRVKLELQ